MTEESDKKKGKRLNHAVVLNSEYGNGLSGENRRVISEVYKKVEEQFATEEAYNNTMRILNAIGTGIAKGRYNMIKKIIPALEQTGVSAIGGVSPSGQKEVIGKTYHLLGEMQKKGKTTKEKEEAYHNLVELYKTFALKSGYKIRNPQSWDLFEKGEPVLLGSLKLHK